MRKGLICFYVGLGVLLVMGSALAAGPGRKMNKMRGMALAPLVNNAKLQQELNLTADQIERLGQVQHSVASGAIDRRAQLKTHRMELHELLTAQNVDRAAVDRKIDEMASVRTALAKESMNAMLAVRTILTPEQLSKLQEKRREVKSKFMGRRQMKQKSGAGGEQGEEGAPPVHA